VGDILVKAICASSSGKVRVWRSRSGGFQRKLPMFASSPEQGATIPSPVMSDFEGRTSFTASFRIDISSLGKSLAWRHLRHDEPA
jgi:hypothetical protein